MRQVAAAAAVVAVVAMSAFGCNGGRGNNTKLSPTGGCTFNSKLSLTVSVVREARGKEEEIGRTPSANPIVIPKCESWFVVPAGALDMAALAKEIASKGLPGLRLSRRATDGDLAHLKGLKGLQWLDLEVSNITDAGLVHLKGLTGLQRLTLSSTITDAGLVHLKGLTALRELNLRGTKITDAGAASLRKALPKARILH